MASAVYGGNLASFGGADSQGFRYIGIAFFDLLNNEFLEPFTPLGTTPSPRASAVLALLPPATPGAPSSAAVLAPYCDGAEWCFAGLDRAWPGSNSLSLSLSLFLFKSYSNLPELVNFAAT
jgi:hypothetical protein